MRQMTFQGFLKQYVKELSEAKTLSVSRLAREAATSNPRLREPLLLYCMEAQKMQLLWYAVGGTDLARFYGPLLDSESSIQNALALGQMSPGYQKVWNSYLSVRDRTHGERESKALYRTKILKLKAQKGFSNYKLYRSLGLNGGNINRWLKAGNDDLVSMETARNVLRLAKEL